ncbi:MAG: PQQ-binding-like beta-propeller repeat protein, partial [Armatimonadetes bacterium]|nr:PQQ-binding-like beta-propeller repeat protein [Armatimonadota bacterium]
FNNYGYAARQVLLMDLDGDHKAETLVASDTGYLYALDATGKPIWQADLGSAVLCLARGNSGLTGGDFIVVGQRDGRVRVLTLRGETATSFSLPGALKLLKCSDLNGDGRDEILAVDQENRFVVLRG